MPDDPPGDWSCCGSFAIASDHPCLPGHFPGDPIVPGVVLLDHALALLQAAHPGLVVRGLRTVRFRQPVLPAQAVAVRAGPVRAGEIAFSGLRAGEIVLAGAVRLETPAHP
jgi:3-hydroxyacyl-[acyl-carrier-protein] dehydratase